MSARHITRLLSSTAVAVLALTQVGARAQNTPPRKCQTSPDRGSATAAALGRGEAGRPIRAIPPPALRSRN